MQKRLLFKIEYVCKIPYGGSRVIFGRQSINLTTVGGEAIELIYVHFRSRVQDQSTIPVRIKINTETAL